MVYYTVGLVSVVRDKILMLGKHVDIVLYMVPIVECHVIDILVYLIYLVMQKNKSFFGFHYFLVEIRQIQMEIHS